MALDKLSSGIINSNLQFVYIKFLKFIEVFGPLNSMLTMLFYELLKRQSPLWVTVFFSYSYLLIISVGVTSFLYSFKSYISCSLKCQLSMISFNQHSEFISIYHQFHSVTTFYLESHIICCRM